MQVFSDISMRLKSALLASVLTVGLSVAVSSAALALSTDSDQPIEISADSLEIIQPNKTATFRGNVVTVQGTVRMKADAMTVHYREAKEQKGGMGAVSRIDADGRVFLTTPEETARGSKGVYSVDEKKVLLTGDVVLTRASNVLKGTRLEYSFKTGRSLITSGAVRNVDGTVSGGRVKALFTPDGVKNKK